MPERAVLERAPSTAPACSPAPARNSTSPNWRSVRFAPYGEVHTSGPVRPSVRGSAPPRAARREPERERATRRGDRHGPDQESERDAQPERDHVDLGDAARRVTEQVSSAEFDCRGATTRTRSPSISRKSPSGTRSTSPRRTRVIDRVVALDQVQLTERAFGEHGVRHEHAAKIDLRAIALEVVVRD